MKIHVNICSSGETLPMPLLKMKHGLNYQTHTEKVTQKIESLSPRILETDLSKKIFSIKLKLSDGF